MTIGSWVSIDSLEDNLTAEELTELYITEKKKQLFIITKGQSEIDSVENNEDRFERIKTNAGIKKAESDAERRLNNKQYDYGDAVLVNIEGI